MQQRQKRADEQFGNQLMLYILTRPSRAPITRALVEYGQRMNHINTPQRAPAPRV